MVVLEPRHLIFLLHCSVAAFRFTLYGNAMNLCY